MCYCAADVACDVAYAQAIYIAPPSVHVVGDYDVVDDCDVHCVHLWRFDTTRVCRHHSERDSSCDAGQT
jgi:hypothetical protein